jgi:nucleoside-diphosphate-sugar epimerase
MKILISGGLGFIGLPLEKALLQRNHKVTIFDRTRINRDCYFRGDICDYYCLENVFQNVKPDIVIHLAAMVSRKESEETPYMAIQTNITGTLNVVLLCLKYNSRLIYAGSSEEYGTAFSGNKKVTEDTPFGEPTSIYSMTKRMAEELIQYYAHFKGLIATTTRFFMLYGPGENASDYRSALIRFMDAAISKKPLNVHKNTVRQWCYIGDAVELLIKIVEKNQDVNYQVFNVGNDEITETEDLAKKIITLTGSTSKINLIPVEETVIPVKIASFKKVRESFDWEATTSIDDGLMIVYNNLKN